MTDADLEIIDQNPITPFDFSLAITIVSLWPVIRRTLCHAG